MYSSVLHISLCSVLQDSLCSHHNLHLTTLYLQHPQSSVPSRYTQLLPMSCKDHLGKKQHLLWFGLGCLCSSWTITHLAKQHFWLLKTLSPLCRAHYCLAIDFQEAFITRIIWIALFRLADQLVLQFLKEHNKDTSVTILKIIYILSHHILHYFGFGFA